MKIVLHDVLLHEVNTAPLAIDLRYVKDCLVTFIASVFSSKSAYLITVLLIFVGEDFKMKITEVCVQSESCMA